MNENYWSTGKLCWVPDEKQAFLEGRFVRRLSDDRALVAVDEGGGRENEQECIVGRLLPRDPDQQCEPEMDNMKDLNEATVLHNIVGLLFSKNCIYCSVGPILIATNPYKNLPIYGTEHIRECHANMNAGKYVAPHAYRTSEEVYQKLRIKHDQNVVICGESGAGKTVTCKKMLEYLCEVAHRESDSTESTAKRGSVASQSSQDSPSKRRFGADPEKIVNANVVLEAFGNAKTLRNDNSSRYGKFTKLLFDRNDYSVRGCDVEHYLLERSRICQQPAGERNYHVFFQLLCSQEKEKYGLRGTPADYAYTKDGASVTGFDDSADFDCLRESMTSGGFNVETQDSIFQAVAAVLHIGNIKITGDKDASKVDKQDAALRQACELLGVDSATLSEAITHERIRPPGGKPIMKEVGYAKAVAQRDTVAKTIYARLFKDMVDLIGSSLGGKKADAAVIGLLDIFGFEDMTTNGFEQMFINLTNERIQKLFNDVVIERELQIYAQEGIVGAAMFNASMDNSECVKLFTSIKPPGIVKLLSGQCQLGEEHDGAKFVQVLSKMIIPQACWKSYFKVCTPQHAQSEKKAKSLGTVPRYEECFMIRHYCSNILYTVQEFIPKSRDALLPHLHETMAASTKPSIKSLFDEEVSGATETVGEKFCEQLRHLADEVLDTGETCFVRCIKSNAKKLPGTVNRPMVLEQLLHGGVVAALEMRRSGLPERVEYREFVCEFESLERCACQGGKFPNDPVKCAKAILHNVVGHRALENRDFAFGTTRVFMSTRVYQFLNAVVKLRWKHYANVVVVRWRFKMCAVKIRNIEECWKRFQDAKSAAQEGDFGSLPRVRKVFQTVEEKLKPAYERLQKEKLNHPNVEELDIHAKKNAFAQIAVAIGEWPGIKPAAAAAETEVERVLSRKAKALDFRLLRVQKALDRFANMLETIDRIETDCVELADVVDAGDLAKCRSSCEKARESITQAQTVALPALGERLPKGVDLDSDGPFEGDPEVEESVTLAETPFKEAEALGEEILRVRGQFLLVARELEEQRVAKLQELSDLHTAEFVEEGLHEVVDIINGAWQRSATVDDLLKAAKDADAYRAAVEAFIKDVDNSKKAVESGQETLEKAKQERVERQKLYTEVGEYKGRLADALSSLTETEIVADPSHKLGGFREQLLGLMEEVAGLWNSERKLEDWRTDIEEWKQRADTKLEELMTHRDEARAARRTVFASKIAIFGQSPAKTSTPVKKPISVVNTGSTASSKIASEGLSSHSDKLLQISALIDELQRNGADRGGVQSCLNSFVQNAYRGGGGARLPMSSPAARSPEPSTPTAPSPDPLRRTIGFP